MEQNVEEAKKHRIAKWGCCKTSKNESNSLFLLFEQKVGKKTRESFMIFGEYFTEYCAGHAHLPMETTGISGDFSIERRQIM